MFLVTEEGITTILYHSIDRAGNTESLNTLDFKIDKTPPEAKIYFDKDNKTLKIEGVDNLSSTQVTQGSPLFTIQDEAGHTLKLVFEEIEQKNKKINAELQSLKYNSDPIIQVAETELEFKWVLNQDRSIKRLMQQIEVEDQFEIRAEFNGRKNETEIKVKTKGKKETKQTLPGLVIVKLNTKAGDLDFEF
jgi:hypothetical protein